MNKDTEVLDSWLIREHSWLLKLQLYEWTLMSMLWASLPPFGWKEATSVIKTIQHRANPEGSGKES